MNKILIIALIAGLLIFGCANNIGGGGTMKNKISKIASFNVNGKSVNIGLIKINDSLGFIDSYKMIEKFNQDHKTNIKMISFQVAYQIVSKNSSEALKISDNFCYYFPVDAVIGYSGERRELGQNIEFLWSLTPPSGADMTPTENLILSMPTGKYKDEKSAAIMYTNLNSSSFVYEPRGMRINKPDNKIILLENFPFAEGWYAIDEKTGMPNGKQVSSKTDGAVFLEVHDGSFISPIYMSLCDSLYLNAPYQERLDLSNHKWNQKSNTMLVEIPDEDLTKLR